MSSVPTSPAALPPSSVGSTGHTNQIVIGVLVQLLRYQFSQADNLENLQLRNKLWTNDIETSSILIEWVWRFKPEDLALRPALMVRTDGMVPLNVSVGQGLVHGVLTDFRVHTIGTEAHIFAISPSEMEAVMLADEVSRHLRAFSDKIRCDLNLVAFRWKRTGPVSLIEECDQHFGVQIVFEVAYNEMQRVSPEAPLLKTINLQTLTA